MKFRMVIFSFAISLAIIYPVIEVSSAISTDKNNPTIQSANGNIFSSGFEKSVGFDIIYVRYPDPGEGNFVSIPQGEKPYNLVSGADLVLLKPDGSEIILVNCDTCSVMDPFISYDGNTVYYSYNEVLDNPNRFGDRFESWIYKINLGDPLFTPIRLTYDDGFDSVLYAPNRDTNGDVLPDHDQSDRRAIRDMSPVPLADGRLLFVSNRAALTTFHPYTDADIDGSIQLMYVMDQPLPKNLPIFNC